ncbi:zeta toxin family protein [Actinoplanes sp. HUAS TT8]|uniref:zeta toxin family protein n=1 Tax=Actinoplanes sp. HUAS TT8 TaxID=3447453 RepID=UPI003F51D1F0
MREGREAQPTLVVIRGNSGSGKTTTTREIRRRYGRGVALIEQDHVRRVVLREHGGQRDPVAPTMIATMARCALDAGYHVLLEGILSNGSYGPMLRQLIGDHPGPSAVYWMRVGFDETVRRHLRREEPIAVTADQMREWFTELDLLGVPGEHIIPESTGFEDAVTTILHTSGLDRAAPLTPCPAACPRCEQKAVVPPTTDR